MPLTLPLGNAICYSGYREGQDPNRRLYPSVAQIREDLLILAKHWQLLRLYDCSLHAERVLQVIREDVQSEVTGNGSVESEETNIEGRIRGMHHGDCHTVV